MTLFVGRHVNKLDRKGRVSVPKSFRAALRAQGSKIFYAYPSFKHGAVEACGDIFLARLSASLDELDTFSDEQDDLAAIILENAHALSLDTEGRAILPRELVEHAGLSEQVIFVGRGARFQIWEPASYDTNRSGAFERARSRGATFKLLGGEKKEGRFR
ncbi:MAG: division/cell wall cluster transcriptional repressor MraZ [Magnetovibrio sp.]|nr:division/cell wall cluster transcriptional repressor MraZ [Magnetovibrio sp.]